MTNNKAVVQLPPSPNKTFCPGADPHQDTDSFTDVAWEKTSNTAAQKQDSVELENSKHMAPTESAPTDHSGSNAVSWSPTSTAECRFWKFIQWFDLHLVCENCYLPASNNLRGVQHKCKKDQVIYRKTEIRTSKWQLLKVQNYSSKGELEVFCAENRWNTERVCQFILECTVDDSEYQIDLPKQLEPHVVRQSYAAQLGCVNCSCPIFKSKWVVYGFPHNCLQNEIFVKKFPTSNNNLFWIRISSRPPGIGPINHKFNICSKIAAGCCTEKGRCCQSPHSPIESMVWMCDYLEIFIMENLFDMLISASKSTTTEETELEAGNYQTTKLHLSQAGWILDAATNELYTVSLGKSSQKREEFPKGTGKEGLIDQATEDTCSSMGVPATTEQRRNSSNTSELAETLEQNRLKKIKLSLWKQLSDESDFEEIHSTDAAQGQIIEAILQIQLKHNFYAVPTSGSQSIIRIRSRRDCLTGFDGDIVEVEITCGYRGKRYGKVKKIVEQSCAPTSQTFVCIADPNANALLTPMNQLMPRIQTKKIRDPQTGKTRVVIYKSKDGNQRFTEGRSIDISSFCNEAIFIVQYGYWGEGCRNPFGYIMGYHRLIADYRNKSELLKQGLMIANLNYNVQQTKIITHIGNLNKVDDDSYNDLSDLLCFTIDAKGSRNLDDAFSIEECDDETYQLIIHIANVSGVVQSGDPFDVAARERIETRSSNLGGAEPYHLLPKDLSESLSLLPNMERFVISLKILIDSRNFDILDVLTNRSKVMSRYRLDYQEAENILNGLQRHDVLQPRLMLLYKIAKKFRFRRLQQGGIPWQKASDMETPMSKLLVCELMIEANHMVAEQIECVFPGYTPIRKQDPPRGDRLKKWLPTSDKIQDSALIRTESDEDTLCNQSGSKQTATEEKTERNVHATELYIPRGMWDKILNAPNLETKKLLLDSELFHTASLCYSAERKKVNTKSVYAVSSDVGSQKAHYELNLNIYTHFTSPIRRYMDIVVHRMLIATQNSQAYPPYSQNELREICNECNKGFVNIETYEKFCYEYNIAVDSASVPAKKLACISEILDSGVTIVIPDFEETPAALRYLKYNLLAVSSNPSIDNDQVLLKWQMEIYTYPHEQMTRKVATSTQDPGNKAVEIPTDLHSFRLLSSIWHDIQACLRTDDDKTLKLKLAEAESLIQGQRKKKIPHISSETYSDQLIQKKEVSFSAKWIQGTLAEVQICAMHNRRILQPTIQLLYVTPDRSLCVDHNRDPGKCFAVPPECKIKQKYSGVWDYQKTWFPILLLESANNVVMNRNSIVVTDVPVQFRWNRRKLVARFKLPASFAEERLIFLSRWSRTFDGNQSLKQISRLDCVCIQVPIESKDFIWVGHFVSTHFFEETGWEAEVREIFFRFYEQRMIEQANQSKNLDSNMILICGLLLQSMRASVSLHP